MKARYRRGGLGDAVLKQRLAGVLETLLAPIRERRAEVAKRPDDLLDIIRDVTTRARDLTQATWDEVSVTLGSRFDW